MPTSEVKQAAATTGLTADDIVKIVEAARKPVKSEKELQEERNKEQERADMRAIHRKTVENKAADQNGCQHEHPSGVGTPVAYIAGLTPPRLYCQHCHVWIFQTVAEAAFNGSLIAPEKHPDLWNRHLAKALAAGMA